MNGARSMNGPRYWRKLEIWVGSSVELPESPAELIRLTPIDFHPLVEVVALPLAPQEES